MRLRTRALLFVLPTVFVIFGLLTYATYRAELADEREKALVDLQSVSAATADAIASHVAEIERVEREAARRMANRLRRADSLESFDRVFPRQADGSYRTPDELWQGTVRPDGTEVAGIGGLITGEPPNPRERREMVASFETLKDIVPGLSPEIESLYFFTPYNGLVMYGPRRSDELIFYRRDAPADFDFQDRVFVQISIPENNPAGDFRCTDLVQAAYDQTGLRWTTGCMFPVRLDGRHLGAWGVSIPLEDLMNAIPDRLGSSDVGIAVVTDEGKLLGHPSLADRLGRDLGSLLDLNDPPNAEFAELRAFVGGANASVEPSYVEGLDAYASAKRIEVPGWTVVAMVPRDRLEADGRELALPIFLGGLVGAGLLAVVLMVFFTRQVSGPLRRIAERADAVAPDTRHTGEANARHSDGSEIERLHHALDAMTRRLAEDERRLNQSFDALVDAVEEYAIVLLDPDGMVLRANAGARNLFALRAGQDGIGKIVRLNEGQSDTAYALLEKAEQEGGTTQHTERRLASGEKARVTETIRPLRSSDGEIFGYAYVAHLRGKPGERRKGTG
ncbi:MAG: PAS domain-containing protein [Sphingomonadaceae bacterium]